MSVSHHPGAVAMTGLLALATGCGGDTAQPKVWSDPESLGHAYPYGAPGAVSTSHLAVAKNGTALVVWSDALEDAQPPMQRLWARHFDPNVGWEAPVGLYSGVIRDMAGIPADLAINASGEAMVAWYYYTEVMTTAVASARFTPSDGWGSLETVATSLAPSGDSHVRVGMSDDGTAFVVSDINLGPVSGEQMWGSQQASGDAWSAPETLGKAMSLSANVAVDPAGNAMAVWRDFPSMETGTARYEPASGWSAAQMIPGSVGPPNRAADQFEGGADGSFVLVLNDQGPWSSRYTPSSGWEEPRLLATSDGDAPYASSLSMNSKGAALVSYSAYQQAAYTRLREPGGGEWGPEELLGKNGNSPACALGDDGSAVAIWVGDFATPDEALSASRRDRDAKWGAPVKLTSSPGTMFVAIGLDGRGDALAVWMDLDGNLFASRSAR